MGAAIATQMEARTTRCLWCPDQRGPDTRRRAHAAGLREATLTEIAASDVVISLVPPTAAEETAHSMAEHGFSGIYVEANAIRPQRMEALAEPLNAGGATVVDACVIGPPPPSRTRTRLYLAGPHTACATVRGLFHDEHLDIGYLGEVGRASALKISHTVAQKATRLVSALATALASDYGVAEELTEIVRTWEHPAADPTRYPGVAARAWRWKGEFEDTATALNEAGLPPATLHALADLLTQWEKFKDAPDTGLADVLSALHGLDN
ncbi:hypothetical protein BJF83_20300 [Nocardiopsis sp. CNR-923]|nr:hypothetical protein BJF83_20300 [Nocardiopsis sp. CNR-923]